MPQGCVGEVVLPPRAVWVRWSRPQGCVGHRFTLLTGWPQWCPSDVRCALWTALLPSSAWWLLTAPLPARCTDSE